jgi:hypothetical protein
MHLHLDEADFDKPERLTAALALIVSSLPACVRDDIYEQWSRLAPAVDLSNLSNYRGESSIPSEQKAADYRNHELHEAGLIVEHASLLEGVTLHPVTDLPPPGTFTAEEIAANDPPFAPAAGASTTSASAAEPAPTNASAVELDADGLPWDERIHSSNHKKTSDGKWWAKRGVDDMTRLKVEAELRSLPGLQTIVDTYVAEKTSEIVGAMIPPPPPAPAASSAPPPPPPPPPVKTELPFPLFVKALNTHNNDKSKTRIETLTINQAIIAMGIAPAVLPTMAKQENWPRLGELAQMIGLEGVA